MEIYRKWFFFLAELRKLSQENAELSAELDDAKSRIVVAEISLESKLEEQDRKAQDEIGSLQKLIYGEIIYFKIICFIISYYSLFKNKYILSINCIFIL